MSTEDESVKGDNQDALTPVKSIPDALQREIRKMRRLPKAFSVNRMVRCAMGCGKGKAYSLTHPDSENAGTWCETHGWLFFDSASLPPTERLSASEIEDRRLEQQRKRGPRQKKSEAEL